LPKKEMLCPRLGRGGVGFGVGLVVVSEVKRPCANVFKGRSLI